MARPCCCRRVEGAPRCGLYKPAGVPAVALQEVRLTVDELEALRLADLNGLYHEQAAERMNVSRPTFGRIIETARHKVAQALVQGKALRIEGGVVEMATLRTFQCAQCGHAWQIPFGELRPAECPKCGSANLHRAAQDRGGPGPGRGRGRCRRSGRAGPGFRHGPPDRA